MDDIPKSRLDDSLDYRQTGMAIVQLWHHTGDALYDLVENHNVFVLDNLGSSSWLVVIKSKRYDKFAEDDSIRWAGPMMPGWRVSDSIDSYTEYISAIPVDLQLKLWKDLLMTL